MIDGRLFEMYVSITEINRTRLLTPYAGFSCMELLGVVLHDMMTICVDCSDEDNDVFALSLGFILSCH